MLTPGTSKTRVIGRADANRIIRLLGEYQNVLEEYIETETLPDGSTMPSDPEAALRVADSRREWQRVEKMVALLEGRNIAC